MMNDLMIFEGVEIEILIKEDVNFDFNGEVLFNGKQVCNILEYTNSSKAISDHIRESQKVKVKNSDITNRYFRKLNNAGETFITEKGVMKLIISSSMPKADDFEDRVWEIVSQVQKTGRFDSKEEKLKLIEDETERNLRLTIHQYETIVKMNPTDVLSGMMLNNKQIELNTYLQSREIKKLKDEIIETNTRISNIFVIGDRKQFTNEVNSVVRATGKDQSEIYTLTYKQLEDDYGIDLKTRVENKKRKIQDDRLNSGKKLLSPSTLKQKVNCLVIADEEQLWNELGKSLFKVKDILLRNKAS